MFHIFPPEPRPFPRDAARPDSSLSLLSAARLESTVSVSGTVTMALASLIRSGLALQPGIYRENGSGKKTVPMFLFVSDLDVFSIFNASKGLIIFLSSM